MLVVKANRYQFRPYDWNGSRVSFSFNNEHSKFASLKSKTRTKTFYQHLRSLITTNGVGYDWNPFHDVYQLRLVKKQGIFEESSKLENLRTFGKVVFPFDQVDSLDVLSRRCSNLQELHISVHRDNASAEICLKLESFKQLHILRLYIRLSQAVSKLQLPSTLKKLLLYNIHIESTIPLIAGLPNLENLRLAAGDLIQSKEWCLGDITLPKLKILKLLEEIPISFAYIPTLKLVKLIQCKNKFLEASAQRIKEEVESIEGCDHLNLIIMEDELGGVPVLVAMFVERSFQRHRVCSIPSSLIFGSFCPILKEKELGFLRVKKRRRREEGEEEEKKEKIKKIRQDHSGFSSGVIPIKLLVVLLKFLLMRDMFPVVFLS
ncbi:hypothetical protein KY285_023053 [Solanum tuberosum]|nr:hypothetical protein KY285_023053 [Solanum tuberosum]